ncbi:MAG TPA: hypothetical protein VMO81_09850 [Aestuariivirgaceae bacterium]|nr:hypothetical protein [Aestuariivirgaceae bacterium]
MSATVALSRTTSWSLGIAAALAVSLVVLVIAEPAVLEAWLLGFILLAGVSVGALALLLTGHILGETWLQPIRAELEAIADIIPMVAVLALPVLANPGALYRWVGGDTGAADRDWLDAKFFVVRSVIYLAVWIAIAGLAKRRHRRPLASGIGLVVLIPSVSLFALDWLASREPDWISGLYGPAFAVSQLLAAMGLGLLLTLIRPGHPGRVAVESLRAALLVLALLTLWTWFSQFVIVWMADLPPEAAWYLGRAGPWLVLQYIAVPALLVAIVLLVPPHAGPLRLVVIAGLLLVQHFAHLIWLIRPIALHTVPALVDIAVLAVLIGLWLVFLSVGLSRRPNLARLSR